MSLSQLLQVNFDSDLTRTISGLFAIQLEFSENASSFPKYKARFVFSPESGLGACETIISPASQGNKVQLVLHTHYFPNGTQHIALTVETPAGKAVWSGAISLNVMNEGYIADQVRGSLHRSNVPIVIEGPCDSSYYDYSDKDIVPWDDRPDALETLAIWSNKGEIDPAEYSALKQFIDEGYTILPERIDDLLLDRVNREIDEAIAQKFSGYIYGSSQRVEHLHLQYPGIRELWKHPAILQFLSKIFRETALPLAATDHRT
jgi:hypothetical protein